jgi:hypothetical protein
LLLLKIITIDEAITSISVNDIIASSKVNPFLNILVNRPNY